MLGSAVNPVLREGNSDRRCAAPVKEHAKKVPYRTVAYHTVPYCTVPCRTLPYLFLMFRIRDVLSRIRIFHSGSRVKKAPDPGSRIPKPPKITPSFRKYNPGCLFRIPNLDFFPFRIKDSRKHRVPDSGPQYCLESLLICLAESA